MNIAIIGNYSEMYRPTWSVINPEINQRCRECALIIYTQTRLVRVSKE